MRRATTLKLGYHHCHLCGRRARRDRLAWDSVRRRYYCLPPEWPSCDKRRKRKETHG